MNFVNIAHSVVVMYVGAYTEDKSTKHTPTYYFIASIFLYYRSHSNNSCIQFHNHTENCLLFQSFVFFYYLTKTVSTIIYFSVAD